MNPLSPRWIALALPAVVLMLASTAAQAFTDSNAELKETAADKSYRVLVVGKAAPPAREAWVPVSPKSLDGFKPVFPSESVVVARQRALLLARADAAASAAAR